ncbi:MAG: aminotransferase class I/II-fold pyridoxal phosphate-dependent enzyme [Planctomycetota bacterium]
MSWDLSPETRLLSKSDEVSASRPLAPDVTLSSVFRMRDLDHVEAIYAGREPGDIYARDGHPNARRLARRLADLEGAESALITSSGMSAIAALFLDILRPGDHLVVAREAYGKTLTLASDRLGALGVHVSTVPSESPAIARELLAPNTKLIFVESISNPLLGVAPIDEWAALAREAGALLAVDGTFAPPPILSAISCGADFVVHSLTKILSGHGDVTLGCIAGRDAQIRSIAGTASTFGLHASAMDCWLTERGLATLFLRIERACDNAMALARYLQSLPGVRTVHYPGLREHPGHGWLAERRGRFGYMLSFELEGGREAVQRCFRGLKLVPFCPSLGDVHTTVSHPVSTSHRGLTPEARERLGIRDGLIRVSAGIEAVQDILADFEQAIRGALH